MQYHQSLGKFKLEPQWDIVSYPVWYQNWTDWNTEVWQGHGTPGIHIHCWWSINGGQNHFGKLAIFYKIKHTCPNDPVTRLLRTYLREVRVCVPHKAHTRIFRTVLITIGPKWKQPKLLLFEMDWELTSIERNTTTQNKEPTTETSTSIKNAYKQMLKERHGTRESANRMIQCIGSSTGKTNLWWKTSEQFTLKRDHHQNQDTGRSKPRKFP